jgi:sugar phosphate isomerase/epimerase
MLLGLHTYSLYHHGLGQDWGGFQLPWPRQMSTFEMFDLGIRLGLDGFHLDDGALESLERPYLEEVARAAQEKGLYLEYNMTFDFGDLGVGIEHDLLEAVETAQALGSDTVKISMDMSRPSPLSGSHFHPQVMPILEETINRLKAAAPAAQTAGIRLALENHCDSFSEEILWVLDQVGAENVGACLDTVNAMHMTEDPLVAAKNLAPRAFTNHFRDNKVNILRDGFKMQGVACGEGDINLRKVYELLRDEAPCERINIETDMGFPLDNMQEALNMEIETVKKCVHYCREVLGIGSEEE